MSSSLTGLLARIASRPAPPAPQRCYDALPVRGATPTTRPGVYVITDLKNKTVYVGSSQNLHSRYRNHCARLCRETSIATVRTRFIFRVLRVTRTAREARALEANTIRRLKPRLTTNQRLYHWRPYVPTGKPRGRPRKGA